VTIDQTSELNILNVLKPPSANWRGATDDELYDGQQLTRHDAVKILCFPAQDLMASIIPVA